MRALKRAGQCALPCPRSVAGHAEACLLIAREAREARPLVVGVRGLSNALLICKNLLSVVGVPLWHRRYGRRRRRGQVYVAAHLRVISRRGQSAARVSGEGLRTAGRHGRRASIC